ncbi:hypothetical protein ACC691_26520 [Rhizobium johnstonii]|uniref:hypothetical protein n=1 Tax=Rhizobium johnstonii TaxID=3019933 RepID=UPI003F95AED4
MSAVDVIKEILDEVLPELHTTMSSMSEGCPGGKNGIPPLNWSERQRPGNAAVESFAAARAALGEGRIEDTKKYTNDALSQWDNLIYALNDSCAGGPHGVDPTNYGNYVRFRDVMKERLRTALRFL